jgi:ParB family transcriptional regulator, chromosome partitioning protein
MPVVKDFVVELLWVDEIFPVTQRRELNEDAVVKLCNSIARIGLQTPITVRLDDTIPDPDTGEEMGGFALVTGLHRLEAFKRLGIKDIPAVVRSYCDETEARKWEIAENLHRADLTAQERDEHIAEWIRLTEEHQSTQSVSNESKREDGKGHRPESGIRAAAREIGINREDARRAVKTASLSDEAKQMARELGLDNNRSALLKAADHKDPEQQVEKLNAITREKNAKATDRHQGQRMPEPQELVGSPSQAAQRETLDYDEDYDEVDEAAECIAIDICRAFSGRRRAELIGNRLEYLRTPGLTIERLIAAVEKLRDEAASANRQKIRHSADPQCSTQ